MLFFFDLDGTILDVSEKYYRLYLLIMKKFECKALTKNIFWKLKRQSAAIYDILHKTNAEKFEAEYQKVFNQNIEKENFLKYDCIWPELKNTYFKIFEKYDSFLVTLRKNQKSLNSQLEKLNLLGAFKGVFFCDFTVKIFEKNKEIKKNMLQKNMLQKNQNEKCFFIGDSDVDIIAGNHFNMTTIAVSFGMKAHKILSLSNPDILIRSPHQLNKLLKEKLLQHDLTFVKPDHIS